MDKILEFSFEEPKLLVFYLGGKIQKCNIEMHDVIFVIAQNNTEAIEKIKQKWAGIPTSFHVDSWVVLENVNGYEISITRQKNTLENKLFFVNLGSYIKNKFGENHFMGFYVVKSRAEAIEVAKSSVPKNEELVHGDNVYDLDDCINIDEIDNYYINLKYSGEIKEIIPTNGYFKIR